MNSNDIIKKIYAAAVKKASKKSFEDKNTKVALEVGGDVAAIGQTWIASFKDGNIDATEEENLNVVFGATVDKWVPKQEGIGVSLLWNGFSLFGLGWKGLKHYLEKWFDLDID